MKKTKIFSILLFAAIGAMFLTGCASTKVTQSRSLLLSSFRVIRAPQQTFYDLNGGVKTIVQTTPSNPAGQWVCSMNNESQFERPTIDYVRQIGFVEKSVKKDHVLKIKLTKIDVSTFTGEASVVLGVSLTNASGKEVYNQQAMGSNTNAFYMPTALNEAYTTALEQINWAQIASFLRIEKLAKDDEKQVDGLGNTALEQTIVRWDVQSRPQGADIFWRVVSKTPDVKSTNNKYLTTTPYEATKALDIKGLTYQTSGNVRIILRCEKTGYLPQEKEFDVRMVLDQEEISAFFRLVKDE